MRAVVQRVERAEVRVEDEVTGKIARGLYVLVGVAEGDDERAAAELAKKVVQLRIFTDAEDKMNLSVVDVGGEVLAVSQFTLLGDAKKGNRPSFMRAMAKGPSRVLFDAFCAQVRALGVHVETGRFGADMRIDQLSNGPVTILLDTERAF